MAWAGEDGKQFETMIMRNRINLDDVFHVDIAGDRLYATTSNGVDWSHVNLPAPHAPALIVLDKKTGALLGEAVGDRVEKLGARFGAACRSIADDLLVRGGPELGCAPGLG